MKLLKKMSLFVAAASMILMLGACSKESSDVADGVSFLYEATKEVDKVIFNSTNTGECVMNPIEGQTKVKKGSAIHVASNYENGVELSIQVIDEGEVIYEGTKTFDLVEGKKVEVKIVDTADGGVTAEVK
ncbi:MAG TPA: hypothetical protein DCY20_04375 [Firmicutes bacterium]|nr:hypothetical protein [Bacillota bacterium]